MEVTLVERKLLPKVRMMLLLLPRPILLTVDLPEIYLEL